MEGPPDRKKRKTTRATMLKGEAAADRAGGSHAKQEPSRQGSAHLAVRVLPGRVRYASAARAAIPTRGRSSGFS